MGHAAAAAVLVLLTEGVRFTAPFSYRRWGPALFVGDVNSSEQLCLQLRGQPAP